MLYGFVAVEGMTYTLRGYAKFKQIQKIWRKKTDRAHPKHPPNPYPNIFWKPITGLD